MKFENIKFTAVATYSDGTLSKAHFFVTEKALSNWANRQYNKDEECTVRVWHAFTGKLYCTYHA